VSPRKPSGPRLAGAGRAAIPRPPSVHPNGLEDLLPAEPPVRFLLMPEEERRWRAKFYLAARATGAPDEVSWATAVNEDPHHVAESKTILANISDEAIREAVAAQREAEADAAWEQLLAKSRESAGASRVTLLLRTRPRTLTY